MLYEETCIELDLPMTESTSVADIESKIAAEKQARDAAKPEHRAGHDTIIAHMITRKDALESRLRMVKRHG